MVALYEDHFRKITLVMEQGCINITPSYLDRKLIICVFLAPTELLPITLPESLQLE